MLTNPAKAGIPSVPDTLCKRKPFPRLVTDSRIMAVFHLQVCKKKAFIIPAAIIRL